VKSRDYLLNSKEAFDKESMQTGVLESRLYLNNLEAQRSIKPRIMQEYDTLLALFESRNEKVGVCFTLEGKAKYLLKLGQIEEASACANEALRIAREVGLVYPLHSILDVVIKTEYESERYKSAADYLLELEGLKDSLMNEDAATQIAMLKAGHDFEKKEVSFGAQIEKRNRQRIGLLVLLVALGIVTISVFLSLRGVAKERKRSDELLTNILPKETARELKETGTSSAIAHKQVTIVFADIVKFTRIASNLEPQALVKMLHTYFSKFDLIIKSFGLEKIKTIGDAYMFVSGLHSSTNNSALKAVESSILMLAAVEGLEKEMLEKYGVSFKFRIGMHTGEVVSGVVGTVKYAFDIWGDAVNIAARVEQNSSPGCINITAGTYELVKDKYNCESRGKMQVKNMEDQEMYFVKAQKKT
ncbi:MAG: adenylate/guanylate cyclase domain-containing protein, partial [Bacteroidia bacterium]|nr:adenylate/guanylate cyclase domain-containing protein [Bacteroidia bacterium]